MLALLLWPMLLALALWVGAALLFWGSWVDSMNSLLQATPVEQWVAQGMWALAAHYLVSIVLLLLLLPAIYVTALLITAVFAMPLMVNHVAAQDYPDLERKRGGSTAGSIVNAIVAIAVYLVGWVMSLPLWLFAPFALVLPILLMAYLNQRLFRYDALAEHATREEYALVVERASLRLYLLGALLGLVQFVPVLNLFAPVFVALAFIHLCLSELREMRQAAEVSGSDHAVGPAHP